MLELLRRRLLERRDRHALRIDRSDHVAHDAALSGRVHGLQHQQDGRVRGIRSTLREQPLLVLVELQRAGREMQILILTCRPRDYFGLDARYLRLEDCRAG